MESFRFFKFPVYQEAKAFYKHCHAIAHSFPREHWGLADQLRRAALSVCLNIAEGSAKYSDKDFHRYLENSLGSVSESLACLDLAKDMELISEKEFPQLDEEAMNINRQLGGLTKKLRSTR